MDIEFIGCAASNFRAGRLSPYQPEAIVIHIMAGSLRGTDLWFGSPVSSVSAHYGIGKLGEVHQYVKEEDTAFHAGTVDRPSWAGIKRTAAGVIANPNYYTIGIEHEGQEDDDWPEPQRAASAAMIAQIAGRWSIPLDRAHVIGHHEIRQSKPCPGSTAPLDELIARAIVQKAGVAAAAGKVTALSNLNVRAGAPNTQAPIRRTVTAGTVIDVAGFTASGEAVRGNSFWYRDTGGDFLWAGNTDRPNPGV